MKLVFETFKVNLLAMSQSSTLVNSLLLFSTNFLTFLSLI